MSYLSMAPVCTAPGRAGERSNNTVYAAEGAEQRYILEQGDRGTNSILLFAAATGRGVRRIGVAMGG